MASLQAPTLLNYVMSIVDWLEAAVDRVDDVHDKLEQRHEKLGAVSPSDPLGRYAFATNRVGRARVPVETNTAAEDKLLRSLQKYIVSNDPLPEVPGKQLQTLLKRGAYTDVIHEPSKSVLYRGLALSRDTLVKLTGLGKKPIPKKGSIDRSVKLKPRKGIGSSWSDAKAVAKDFAHSATVNASKTPYEVILTATREDNPDRFVTGSGGLYNLDDLARMSNERESIGLGPIKISRIEWKINPDKKDDD